MALALGAAIAPWNTVSQVDLPVGAVANRTFKAPRTITYTSDVRTQEKRDEAANDDRLRVFNRNTTLVAAQQNQYDSDLRKLAEIRGSTTSLDDRVKAVQGIITDMTTDEARQLLLLDAPRWGAVTNAAKQLLEQTMAGTVTIEQLAQIKDDLPQRADLSLA
jgi:membrane-associated HD superfamily phosphohydrolase